MPDLAAAGDMLRATFGFPSFRPGQAEIVKAVLEGRDVLAVMPTGSGKSLCYQLPAILRDGLTLVVSPLIALMRNQVAQLRSWGIAAASLNSANDFQQNRAVLGAIARGTLRLVYVAPERLTRSDTLDLLKRSRVSLLAVDEAHCISQWGHDFRPEYMELGAARTQLGGVQIIALTATADAATRADIVDKLFREPPSIFVHGFDRPNLKLMMRPKSTGRDQVLDFVTEHRGQSGIVYCGSRRKSEELAGLMAADGVKAVAYHAGMEPAVRSRHQDMFLQEDGVVVAATIAFGMGIDKPDVRFVCHADLPANIESYYQEIGRAGRDGLPADTLTLYGIGDIRLRRQQIERSEASDEQKRVERQRLGALVALCESPRCRRQTLLAYFGETVAACGNCDLCLDGIEAVDATIAAQKALSAIIRTGERFGTEHLVSLLCGEETEAIAKFGHARLPTFGVGKEHSRPQWRSIFRQLYGAGIIALDVSGYGRWTITEAGRGVLRGKARVSLRRDVLAPGRGARVRDRARDGPSAGLSAADQASLEALKQQRTTLAKAQGVPAYVIFPDRSLIEMARMRPASLRELARVHGVGEAKLAQFGEVFLAVLRGAVPPRPMEPSSGPTLESGQSSEGTADPALASIVAQALAASGSWEELQQRLAAHDLEYFERGGGVALRVRSSGSYVAKASAAGPGYAELMRRFGAPFPGHAHSWLATRTIKDSPDQ
jgi:ATP-dependent DNA helicase RecQ